MGGSSSGVAITNSGTLTATLAGQGGFAGIQALSVGGAGGSNGSDAGGAAGDGGLSSVISSAPVNLNWTWSNPGNGVGLYGIEAASVGGNGGGSNQQLGGSGGNAGAASVTLSLGGNVTVAENGTLPAGAAGLTSAGIAVVALGGAGGFGGTDDNNTANYAHSAAPAACCEATSRFRLRTPTSRQAATISPAC